jgi:hypothetical protein
MHFSYLIKTCIYKSKSRLFIENKKAFQLLKGLIYVIGCLNYFLNLAYLFLNLSIRPAVSTNLDLPV